jgi:hypothetical protein
MNLPHYATFTTHLSLPFQTFRYLANTEFRTLAAHEKHPLYKFLGQDDASRGTERTFH